MEWAALFGLQPSNQNIIDRSVNPLGGAHGPAFGRKRSFHRRGRRVQASVVYGAGGFGRVHDVVPVYQVVVGVSEDVMDPVLGLGALQFLYHELNKTIPT